WKRAQCVITSIESSEQNPKVVLEVVGDQPDIWTLQPTAETLLNRNRRKHKRFVCLGDVEIRSEDADQIICTGTLNDISFGADTVRVRINVGDELFVGNGRIVTSSEVGLGIEFAILNRAAAQQLSRIIRQLQ